MHEHHRERVKNRFLKEGGLGSFEEHQALEFLLFYALPRKDTNELAHNLLDAFGSIKKLFAADVNDIAKIKGMGMHSAILIKLIPELYKYYCINQDGSKKYIKTIGEAVDIIKPILQDKATEHIYIFCLSNRFMLTHYQLLSKGTFTDVRFTMRTIAEIAFRFNSEKIILAHNHPSGSPQPSITDINTTQQIANILSPIDIQLVDHIIFTDRSYYSFVEDKMIQMRYAKEDIKAAQYTGVWFSDEK